jgi:hypothetical protein
MYFTYLKGIFCNKTGETGELKALVRIARSVSEIRNGYTLSTGHEC